MPDTQQGSNAKPVVYAAGQSPLMDGLLQADTFVRGAANAATFGLADNLEAAANATFHQDQPGDWSQRYHDDLKQEAARDVYNSIYRGFADRLGQATGVGLQTIGGAEGGVGWSEGLPSVAKGELGETLSEGKTILKGDIPVKFQHRVNLDKGGYTRADHVTQMATTSKQNLDRTQI